MPIPQRVQNTQQIKQQQDVSQPEGLILILGSLDEVIQLHYLKHEKYLAEKFKKQHQSWRLHLICGLVKTPTEYTNVVADLCDRIVGSDVPVLAVFFYPQYSDCSYFRPFMSSVIKTTKPYSVIGILPCVDENDEFRISTKNSEERNKYYTCKNKASLGCFRMFMEFRKVNVVNLSQPGEIKGENYLDRLFERTKLFIPEPADVVPLKGIKSGKLVAASPMTEMRFPSRKKGASDYMFKRTTNIDINKKSKSFRKRVKPAKITQKPRLSSKSMSEFDQIEREEFIYIV